MKLVCLFMAILLSFGSFNKKSDRLDVRTTVVKELLKFNPVDIDVYDLMELPVIEGVRRKDERFEKELIPLEFTEDQKFNNLSEGMIIKTRGWIHYVSVDSHNNYYVQISDSDEKENSCFVVQIPDPRLMFDKDVSTSATASGEYLRKKFLKNKKEVVSNRDFEPIRCEFVGQLFYNVNYVGSLRGKKGMKTNNAWEIQPLIDVHEVPPILILDPNYIKNIKKKLRNPIIHKNITQGY